MDAVQLRAFAGAIIRKEADALGQLADSLPDSFGDACQLVVTCTGAVVLSGVGKAGIIGRKISATLNSTGTRSFTLDPLNAFHGDLGSLASGDVVVLLSNSGGSAEMLLIADYCRNNEVPVVSITSVADSPIGKRSDVVLPYGSFPEACPLRLAPSTSTTLMLAMGDALALTVQHLKGFSEADFARFHPAGALGRHLRKVDEMMRTGDQVAVVSESTPVFEAIAAISKARCGLCLVVDTERHLTGVYSDGDFRRDGASRKNLQDPVGQRCVKPGKRIVSGESVGKALEVMRSSHINALPVVDAGGRLLGLLDIQDIA